MREINKEIEDKLKEIALRSFINADIQSPRPDEIMNYFEMLKNAWIKNEFEIEE